MEGDSILRLARQFNERVTGAPVSVSCPGRRRPVGRSPQQLNGRVLERAESRGKHLLLRFDGGLVLHSHLGMKGSWHLYRRGERWRRPRASAWIVLSTEGFDCVNFGGSTIRIVREPELWRDPRLSRLGPDLLAADFEISRGVSALRGGDFATEIGEALLDQTRIAGIGNIFRSEGLFAARISPWEPIGALRDDEVASALDRTRGLMLAAVETGRHRSSSRIYRRAPRPCRRCGTPIRSAPQGEEARIVYWCPRCQPRRER